MIDRGQTESFTMDSPLVEFEDIMLPDGTVVSRGPEVVFLGKGAQVRWGNALARLGICLDRGRMIWRANHGDWFFVSTASDEYRGNAAILADDQALQLTERADPEADDDALASHSILWDTITRVGIVPAPIDSPGCA
jgi:hypothetical protein